MLVIKYGKGVPIWYPSQTPSRQKAWEKPCDAAGLSQQLPRFRVKNRTVPRQNGFTLVRNADRSRFIRRTG
jgi:hypothetical protein